MMKGRPRSPVSLSLVAFLLGMAFSQGARTMSMVQIPVYLRELGADIGDVGLFFTLSMVFPLVLRVLGGWLSDSIGRLRAITLGALAGMVGFLVFVVAPIWQVSLLAPVFLAVATSLSVPSYKAYIADHTQEDQRGRVFGLAEAATTAGWIIGPPIGGVIGQYLGYRWMLAASAAAFAVSFLIFLVLSLTSRQTRLAPVDWPRLSSLRTSLREMMGLLLAGGLMTWLLLTDGIRDIAFELSFDLMPVYLRDIMRIDKQSIGALDGIFGLALTAASYPGGWLIDKTSERVGVVLGLISVILSRLVFAVADSFWEFALSWVLLGIGAGLLDPAYSSLIAKGVPQRFRGMAYGLLATSLGIISLPSPWIGSQIWEQFGPKVPFVLTAILGALALVPAWVKLVAPTSREALPEGPRTASAMALEHPHVSSGISATAPFTAEVAPPAGSHFKRQATASTPGLPRVPAFQAEAESAYVTVLVGAVEGLRPASPYDPTRLFPLIAAIMHKYGGVFQQHGTDAFYAAFESGRASARPQVSALLATHAALETADFLNSVAAKPTGESRTIRFGIGIATGIPEPGPSAPTKTKGPQSGGPREIASRLQRIAMRSDAACLLISGDTYRFLANVKEQFLFGRFGKAPPQAGVGEAMLYEVLGRKRSLIEGRTS